MPRRSPYDGHADFYLLDVWARRDEMNADEVAVLHEEMSRRGLSVDGEEGGAPYREPPPPVDDARACPVCAGSMTQGQVFTHRSAVVGSLPRGPSGVGAHCYFIGPGGGDATIVFKQHDSPSALLCNGCGTVVIRGHFAG